MALILPTTLDSGLECNYWRATHLTWRRDSDTMEVYVGLYKDADARTAGRQPVLTRSYVVAGITLSEMQGADDPVQLAYTKLHESPEFAEAEDA